MTTIFLYGNSKIKFPLGRNKSPFGQHKENGNRRIVTQSEVPSYPGCCLQCF